MIYQLIQKYDSILKSRPLPKNEVLKRFNLPCVGTQDDYQSILKKRSQKYSTLKKNKTSKEYKSWFFKYTPRKYNVKRKSRKIKE